MAAQPTGPPARRCRAFAGANQSNPDLDFRGKSLQTESSRKPTHSCRAPNYALMPNGEFCGTTLSASKSESVFLKAPRL
jgi:hypothetical protein